MNDGSTTVRLLVARASFSQGWTRGTGGSTLARRALIPGLFGLATGLGAGCGSGDRALESSAHYTPPAEHRVVVETVVEAPFDAVWDGLIERIPASDLILLTSDKTTRFLVVDLDGSTDAARSRNRPGRFVDCGRVRRSFVEGGRVMQFEFGIAESSRHVEVRAESEGFEVRDVTRAVDLSGRATVHLDPADPKQTRVTVNSRYALTVETGGTTHQVPRDGGAAEGEPRALAPLRETARFTTFTRSAFEGGASGTEKPGGVSPSSGSALPLVGDGPVCGATGELERVLLALSSAPETR